MSMACKLIEEADEKFCKEEELKEKKRMKEIKNKLRKYPVEKIEKHYDEYVRINDKSILYFVVGMFSPTVIYILLVVFTQITDFSLLFLVWIVFMFLFISTSEKLKNKKLGGLKEDEWILKKLGETI